MKKEFINALKEKKIVGFPTDTVYGIGCILDKKCVERLREIKKRSGDKPFSIFIPDTSWLKRFDIFIPDYAKRLVDEMKGPLTIVFKLNSVDKFDFITKDGKIGIRIPDDEFLCDVMRELNEPIVATSANITGFSPAVSSDELNLNIDFFIKGYSKIGLPSTVVDISGEKAIILRKGAKPILEVEKKTGDIYLKDGLKLNLLFVCSGNTCRSPMAEYHFRFISDPKKFNVWSFGTLNIFGMPPSPEAIIVMDEIDVDITSHLSKGISKELIDEADIILPMEKKHKEILLSLGTNNFKIIPYYKILGLEKIPDPIGEGLPYYRKIRELIVESNKILLEILDKKYLRIN